MADLITAIQKLNPEGAPVKICYESTYSGFHLCRKLREAGYDCSVIAAGLIPGIAGNRVKNDRLDAEKLARLFLKGMLTEVHLPELDDELDRTLVRSRTYLMSQLRDLKRHIISVSKQIGWHYREEQSEKSSYWTETHRRWIIEKVQSAPDAVKMNFKLLLAQMGSLEQHLDSYAEKIQELAATKKYKKRVKSLVCYRGISELTAMVLVTEIGDIKRFPRPKNLVSYIGMDISEYSSGGKERRYSMTKMGNKHLRTALIESSQSAQKTPGQSRKLKERRKGCDIIHVATADRCMKRLHSKATRLIFRGKPVNKVKAACARELVGFVWESLMSVETGKPILRA